MTIHFVQNVFVQRDEDAFWREAKRSGCGIIMNRNHKVTNYKHQVTCKRCKKIMPRLDNWIDVIE